MRTRLVFLYFMSQFTIAAAGTDFVVTVKPGGITPADKCKVTATANAGASDSLKVDGITVPAAITVSVSVAGGGPPPAAQTLAVGASPTVTFAAGSYANETVTATQGAGTVCAIKLAPPGATQPDPLAPGQGSDTDKRKRFVGLNNAARTWLLTRNISEHGESGYASLGRKFTLYHLPDGSPAFPIPQHITEKDTIELKVVVPEDAFVAIDVTSCDAAPVLRVSGSYAAAVGTPESAEVVFREETFPKYLKCAGTLTYKADVEHGDLKVATTTTVPVDPVYRLEWGVGYMFDFGRPRKISLADRPAASGMGNEKFIVETKDYSGSQPAITLSYNLCRTNPQRLTWCDVISPTVALDPTRLADGAGVGFMVRPAHGIGVILGMSVFETTELKPGIVERPGDTWTATGDPPTKGVFDRRSLGFFIGAVVTPDVLTKLRK